MSATVEKEESHTWRLRISGVLKKAELDSVQELARQEIERAGNMRVLLMLEDFQGWERGAHWDDVTFTAAYGHRMEKIAIVGDPRWETVALMFVGAGLRRTPVKFFAREQEALARAWLSDANDQEQLENRSQPR